ncbi:hypothetical protein C0995_013633 [Termitomyces sp. Mi166|nr:hypothetical protein C0995_013633 [Termitomyces sp. Mi166\
MALDQSSSPSTSIIPFHFFPCSNPTLTTSASLRQLHFSLARFFIIEVTLQSTSATHAALIDSSATGTFVSSKLALPIGEPIKLQLFDGTPAASGLITNHYSGIISLANGLNFSANPIPSHATPLEQLPQPGDDTAQPQNNAILLSTPFLTFSKPNMMSLKPCSCSPLTPYSFPPNIPWNRYKGPHRPQSPSPTARPMPTKDAQNPPSPELPNGLDIRIIGAALFAQIIWEGAQAYQLHVSPSLLEEHLWADTDIPASKTKLKDQILHKVIPPKYHKYANMFSKGGAKELPPHHLYDHKIDLEKGTSPLFKKSITCQKSNYTCSRITSMMCLERNLYDPLPSLPAHLSSSPKRRIVCCNFASTTRA